jgi:hypothetical protein
MAIEYRDIGSLGGPVVPQEVDQNTHTQVYLATHDGDGKRLPYYRRSFISFSYGGKLIEDFGFIAITENNSIQRNIYADFTDNVTESDVIDGQLYWSTHFNANTLELSIFTDGVTERELEDFKHWFCPGVARELILSEHPNRGIMARLSEPPEYSILPFEQKVMVKLAGHDRETSTTLYKGKVTLSFVMDDPFWYSLTNILDVEFKDDDEKTVIWHNVNGEERAVLREADAVKMILEDGVPTIEMKIPTSTGSSNESFEDTVLLGTSKVVFANLSADEQGSLVGELHVEDDKGHILTGARVDSGHVAYQVTADNTTTLEANKALQIYYPGTAPGKPIISFTLAPKFGLSPAYIATPGNTYLHVTANPYNSIFLKGKETQRFDFTTPSIWTGYNQAIWIFEHAKEDVAWEDIRKIIRDNVRHFAPREYAIKVIEKIEESAEPEEGKEVKTTTRDDLNECQNEMKNFLCDPTTETKTAYPAVFEFDSTAGRARGKFTYNVLELGTNNQWKNTPYILEEDVGDMVRSKYLTIVERNVLSEDGYIRTRTEEHPEYTQLVYHDLDAPLTIFNFKYKYLYL